MTHSQSTLILPLLIFSSFFQKKKGQNKFRLLEYKQVNIFDMNDIQTDKLLYFLFVFSYRSNNKVFHTLRTFQYLSKTQFYLYYHKYSSIRS